MDVLRKEMSEFTFVVLCPTQHPAQRLAYGEYQHDFAEGGKGRRKTVNGNGYILIFIECVLYASHWVTYLI